jgi:hypothetical protein
MRILLVGMAVLGVVGGLSGAALAQSPLTTIERSQKSQLDANRNKVNDQLQERFQQNLELEKQFFDENRRRRENYRYQGNTTQRSLETQLREDSIRINQQDQANREREFKQRAEEAQGLEEARQRAQR